MVTPSLIQKDIEEDLQKSNVFQENKEVEITEEIMKKV